MLHEVVYGEDSSKAIAQFGGAAEELRVTLKGIRDGNGIAGYQAGQDFVIELVNPVVPIDPTAGVIV